MPGATRGFLGSGGVACFRVCLRLTSPKEGGEFMSDFDWSSYTRAPIVDTPGAVALAHALVGKSSDAAVTAALPPP